MGLFILNMLLAFIFFVIVVPLIGVLIGGFCYYVMPYILGGVLALLMAMAAGLHFFFAWWVWTVAFVWAATVYLMRIKFRNLGDDVEHYRAAHATILGGLPYHRRKNQLEEALAGEV